MARACRWLPKKPRNEAEEEQTGEPIGDGADWIWNICQEQFPGAIQIVDLYHARQHLWDLGGKLHPNDEKAKRRWVMAHQHFLDDGKIEKLVAKLRSLSPDNRELAAAVRIEANYFQRNAERMRYPKFRKQNLFCRLRRYRSRMQNRDRLPPQALRHVLDRSRSQRRHCAPLLPPQPPVWRLPGAWSPLTIAPYRSRTPGAAFPSLTATPLWVTLVYVVRNITFSLPRELIRSAKIAAAERDISLNALVREALEGAVTASSRSRRAAVRLLRKSRAGLYEIPPGSWSRNGLYE
jgi:hypothetical protein